MNARVCSIDHTDTAETKEYSIDGEDALISGSVRDRKIVRSMSLSPSFDQ